MLPWFEFHTVNIGPIPIQVWGFWVALGIGIGTWMLICDAKKKGISPERILDMLVWGLIGGLIGARLLHVFGYEAAYYLAHPVDSIKIWEGGMSSFGGMLGAGVGVWAYFKRHGSAWITDHVAKAQFADMIAFPLVTGWIIGRIGCVMIHDHPGIPCDCILAFDAPGGARLDMAFLEILGLVPFALVLWYLKRKKQLKSGMLMALLVTYYGALRFILDFFRAYDVAHADSRYFGLTPAQYIAMVMVIGGGCFLWKKLRNREMEK